MKTLPKNWPDTPPRTLAYFIPDAAKKRAQKAAEIILRGDPEEIGSRAYDNCFESGDTFDVIAWLVEIHGESPEFHAALAKNARFFFCGEPKEPLPARWKEIHTEALGLLGPNALIRPLHAKAHEEIEKRMKQAAELFEEALHIAHSAGWERPIIVFRQEDCNSSVLSFRITEQPSVRIEKIPKTAITVSNSLRRHFLVFGAVVTRKPRKPQ